MAAISIRRTKKRNSPAATTNSTILAPTAGSRLRTPCPMTSFMWRRARAISAGNSTARTQCAARRTMESLPPAFRMRGTSITLRTTPRRKTRIFTSARPSRTRPRQISTTRSATDWRTSASNTACGHPSGELIEYYPLRAVGLFGNPVTITGANGYSATGQRATGLFRRPIPTSTSSPRIATRLRTRATYRFTPHLAALIGFHYRR